MRAIVSLLQFTTILPLGKAEDLKKFAQRSYLYPLAGYCIGGIVALMVFFIQDRMIAAAVGVAGVILLSGAHHFDGLLDFGDGLMAHGDREKRIRALTDRQVGAGGIAAGLIVTILLFAGLHGSPSVGVAIIAGEVCAKFSMSFLTAYGEPFREGIHSYLHSYSQQYFPVIAALLCIPLLFLPISPIKIVGSFVIMILCPALLLLVSRNLFGGVNGDVSGASNEITRACVVLAIALL